MKVLMTILVLMIFITNAAADCVTNVPSTSGPFDKQSLEGQLIDRSTGLVWYRCHLGETFENGVCSGDAFQDSWGEALLLAEEFEFGGFDNWRLPNIKELQSLVEYACYSPPFEEGSFATVMNFPLWSSTPELVQTGLFNQYAYLLSSRGTTASDQKDETFYAIMVRDLNTPN